MTKFLAKTCTETHNLFDNEEIQIFPLIASKPPTNPAYLSALNPSDQIFDFEELEYYYQVANRKPTDDEEQGTDDEDKKDISEEIEASPPKKKSKKAKEKEAKKEIEIVRPATPEVKREVVQQVEEKVIDNPFLKLKPKVLS